MPYRAAPLLLLLCFSLSAETLDDAVHRRIARFDGEVSIYAKNLTTGVDYGLRPDAKVRTASTIKLPILCALYDLAERRKLSWEERLTVTEGTKVAGSGVLTELSNGVALPVRDVAHLMIVVSDNTATNLILDRITADAVNDYLDTIGLTATRSLRKVRGDGAVLKEAEGWSAAGKLPENERYGLGVSTPREMVRLLEMLNAGRIVSPAASKEILATLARQQYKDGIGRHRADRVASKSGSLDALRSDVGIVTLKHSKLAIAITVDRMPKVDYSPDNVGEILISDLTDLLVAHLGDGAPAKPAKDPHAGTSTLKSEVVLNNSIETR